MYNTFVSNRIEEYALTRCSVVGESVAKDEKRVIFRCEVRWLKKGLNISPVFLVNRFKKDGVKCDVGLKTGCMV